MAESLHTYTLGLVMAAPFWDTDDAHQGEVMGLAFILVSETTPGKFSVNEEMTKLANLGFKPIIVVGLIQPMFLAATVSSPAKTLPIPIWTILSNSPLWSWTTS
jgi:hypothetical protein